MEDNMTALLQTDTFRFSCSQKVACFNECCKDLNQMLTPYDILRLKNRLKITSDVFLERYTIQHTGPGSGLPVVTFKPMDSELKCPFVTPSGCSVYEDRPSSCRIYPLMRLASRSRETGKITEQYVLLKEPHCFGFEQNQTQTVNEWLKDQGALIYNKMNDMLMEIIALKNMRHPEPLDIKSGHFFHMACYDLDTFRKHVFENNILDNFSVDTNTLDMIKNDDTALLKLSLEWIKKAIFAI